MKSFLIKILGWLSGSTKTVFAFLLPILADSTAKLMATLLPIALEVVTGLSDTSKTGAEKRAHAVYEIKQQAISAGIGASASAINLAVELAVAKLKEAK